MNKNMEQMIARDLQVEMEQIRTLPWEDLERLPREVGVPFRPKDAFPVGGNINLSENRMMGMNVVTCRLMLREVCYKIRCLRKNRKHA